MSSFTAVENMPQIEDITTDFKKARRYGQYKIGDKAIFFANKTYIPLSEITEVVETTAQVPTKGCCGMVLTSPAVEFMAGGKKRRVMADSEKQAKGIADAISYKKTI